MSKEPNIHVMHAILERVEHKLDVLAESSVSRSEHNELKTEVKSQRRLGAILISIASAVSAAITKALH